MNPRIALRLFVFSLLVPVGVLASGSASADTIARTVVLEPPPIWEHRPFECGQSGPTEYSCAEDIIWFNEGDPLGFDRFDPSLGSLTSVTFHTILSVDFQTEYSADQPGFDRGPTDAYLDFDVRLDSPYSEGEIVGSAATRQLGRDSCEGPCFLDWSLSVEHEIVVTSDLARFVGAGTFPVYYDAALGIGSFGFYEGIVSPSQVGHLEITASFGYLPAIPEPTTGLLWLAGLAVAARASLRGGLRA